MIAMVILYAVLMIPVTSWLNLLSMLFVRNAFESFTVGTDAECTLGQYDCDGSHSVRSAKNLRSVVSIIMDIVREVCGVRFLDLHWRLV